MTRIWVHSRGRAADHPEGRRLDEFADTAGERMFCARRKKLSRKPIDPRAIENSVELIAHSRLGDAYLLTPHNINSQRWLHLLQQKAGSPFARGGRLRSLLWN